MLAFFNFLFTVDIFNMSIGNPAICILYLQKLELSVITLFQVQRLYRVFTGEHAMLEDGTILCQPLQSYWKRIQCLQETNVYKDFFIVFALVAYWGTCGSQ